MPRIDITQKTIAKALADAKPGGGRYEISDARSRGLILRVGPAGVQWQLRFQVSGRDKRVPVGSVEAWTITESRQVAGLAQTLLRDRRAVPDAAWVESIAVKLGKAPKPADLARPSDGFKWTWRQGRDAYLDTVRLTRREATWRDYKHMLTLPELKGLEGRALPSITRAEVSKIVSDIHLDGRESTAAHLVRVVRPFFAWLALDAQVSRSGVAYGLMHGLKAPERTLVEHGGKSATKPVPGLEQLARIVAIARSGVLNPYVAGAVELAVWTSQRRSAIAAARIADFEGVDDIGGLWHVPPLSRKSGRRDPVPHTITIPMPAWAHVFAMLERRRRDGDESPWLFPAARPRRAGDAVGHIHPSTISQTISALPRIGTDTHGIRRGFATHGEARLGLLRSETRAILDHAEGGEASDVTGRHYALHDGSHRKWPIMRRWVDALVPLVETAVSDLEDVETLKAAIAATNESKL